MYRKVLSMMLSIAALFALCAVSQAEPAEDFLSQISGSYVELFPEMAKAEYRDEWIAATAPIVGEENAEATVDMLLASCMAEAYGDEAAALYAQDPASMRFNCYFLGGVDSFVMEGDVIRGLDEHGAELFAHSYVPVEVENESGFIFYKTEDADAGQFTYFAFAPDTMETTYHLEFRYAEDVGDLMSWFEGKYAYWNAAGIAADYSDAQITSAISLFASENLAAED